MPSGSQAFFFRRIAVAAALISGAAGLVWHSAAGQALFEQSVVEFAGMAANHPTRTKLVFVGLAALSAMVAPFSSVPLAPIVVAVWGNALTAALLLGGWLLGGTLSYVVGSTAGVSVVERLVGPARLRYYQRRIAASASFPLVLLFRIAMPAEVPGYLLGLIRYDLRKYFAATFLAELPVALIVVYASQAFRARQEMVFLVLVGAALAALCFFIRAFHRINSPPEGDELR